MTSLVVENKTRGLKSPLRVKKCSGFFQKFRGLMFKRTLTTDEGIVLIEKSDSIISSSIHMFFMNFDLGIVWVNGDMQVVDRCVAEKWHPYYASKEPARFTLEVQPSRLTEFEPGDHLEFRDEA